MLKTCLALILFVVASASPAWAWWDDGHRIIALIAEKSLTPAVKAQVDALLAHDPAGQTLHDVSVWADKIRLLRPDTAGWHYVNIPITANGYSAQRDCAGGNCVEAKIQELGERLQDKQILPAARAEALKFLVHLVGDLHQPLHCADNNDRGGNLVTVVLRGRIQSLHALWDSGVQTLEHIDTNQRAEDLLEKITPAKQKAWNTRGPSDWVNESFAIAKTFIYPRLGAGTGSKTDPVILPASYQNEAEPIVREQLMKAGTRLASILNSTLM